MNKKLFSWKALAGLALLVAMGLTSCKQGTEVDPNDPYNTTKPAQPGTSTKGGDLVFTITKTADLASLWASYDATKKADLMKKTELNIVINSGAYKLDGGVLTLPKFFNTSANSVLNLTFNGNFQDADKQPLNLDASTNLSGAKVNITLPAQTFNMGLDATNVAATLTSAGATIGTFAAAANANKNNALTIGSGVTVKGIDDASTGAIVTNGGTINALILNGTPAAANYVTKKGFKIANGEIYTTNLIINAAGITVTNDKDTPLGDIIINKNCDVTLGFANAIVKSITGTKASESKATVGAWNIGNYGALKNVEITNNGITFGIYADNFDGVKIDDYVDIYASSLSNVTLGANAGINFNANGTTFTFNNVGFSAAGSLGLWGGIPVSQTPTKVTYQWDIDKKVWVEVTAAAPITAANASDTGIEVSSNDVSVTATGNLVDNKGLVGDHKVFTIVWANAVYIQAENCGLFINKCTMNGAALVDNNINNLFGWAAWNWLENWFSVTLDGTPYKWAKSSGGAWVLIK